MECLYCLYKYNLYKFNMIVFVMGIINFLNNYYI